jgi:antitoxin component YwqK of YwqJK toxin-antitoxin module
MEVKNLYRYGSLDGVSTQWKSLGFKDNEITYRNGEKHGPATYRTTLGKIEAVGNYKNNLHDGLWLFWDRDGIPETSRFFKDGKEEPLPNIP